MRPSQVLRAWALGATALSQMEEERRLLSAIGPSGIVTARAGVRSMRDELLSRANSGTTPEPMVRSSDGE